MHVVQCSSTVLGVLYSRRVSQISNTYSPVQYNILYCTTIMTYDKHNTFRGAAVSIRRTVVVSLLLPWQAASFGVPFPAARCSPIPLLGCRSAIVPRVGFVPRRHSGDDDKTQLYAWRQRLRQRFRRFGNDNNVAEDFQETADEDDGNDPPTTEATEVGVDDFVGDSQQEKVRHYKNTNDILFNILLIAIILVPVLYEGLWKLFWTALRLDFVAPHGESWSFLDAAPSFLVNTARLLVGASLVLEGLGVVLVLGFLAFLLWENRNYHA